MFVGSACWLRRRRRADAEVALATRCIRQSRTLAQIGKLGLCEQCSNSATSPAWVRLLPTANPSAMQRVAIQSLVFAVGERMLSKLFGAQSVASSRRFAGGSESHDCVIVDRHLRGSLADPHLLGPRRSGWAPCRNSRSRRQTRISTIGPSDARGRDRSGAVRCGNRRCCWDTHAAASPNSERLADPRVGLGIIAASDWRLPIGWFPKAHPPYSLCASGFRSVLTALSGFSSRVCCCKFRWTWLTEREGCYLRAVLKISAACSRQAWVRHDAI